MALAVNAKTDALHLTYDHAPLRNDEIRVLYLEPAANLADPLFCRIDIISLSQCQERDQYRALSYAWGPVHNDGTHLTDTIACDDRQIPITTNLAQALRRLRNSMHSNEPEPIDTSYFNSTIVPAPKPPSKWLWVDAICINQLDTAERSEQVSLMAKIYERSERLEVWLGEMSPDPAMEALEHELLSTMRDKSSWYERSQLPSLAAHIFFQRPWFHRRWVLQEYRLSGEVWWRLGEYTLQFWGGRLHDLLNVRGGPTNIQLLAYEQDPRPLLCELQHSRHLQCSLPHDLVYALLHISMNNPKIPVDYAMAVEDLYITVATQLTTRSTPMLQTLLACATAFRSCNVPSWVPDWRACYDERSLIREHDACIQYICWHATRDEKSSEPPIPPAAEVNGRALLVQGYILQPCFPPLHDAFGTCKTCRLATHPWKTSWSNALKSSLSTMITKKEVLLMLKDHNDISIAYVLTPFEQVTSSLGRPTFQLNGLCFQIPFQSQIPFQRYQAQLPALSTIMLV
ncbi:hypothetical protein LTR17_014999 [Elasticomyces elasticus]|nr:hypothetical protein LTR17_014999 [Elasticomyces elasticus]